MNMKMEETDQTGFDDKRRNYSDIDEPDIDVKLPTGALKGLKDASLDQVERMDTEQMNKQLEKSLKLEVKKGGNDNDAGEFVLDSKKRSKKGKKQKDPKLDNLNQPSITNMS